MTGAVLVTGATSGIGAAVARRLAERGHALVLAARDAEELDRVARDLRIRSGHRVATRTWDARAADAHHAFFSDCLDADPDGLAGVVLCHGSLGTHERARSDPAEAQAIFDINLTSSAAILGLAADHLQARGSGFLCAISSVAGDRGRQSNYVYGAAKAGLDTYLAGLRHRLFRDGIPVITVKPGFVDTAMTYGQPGMFLVADPDRVARDVCRAIARGRSIVYTPWFWRWIMLVIRRVPGPVFHRTEL